VGSRVIFTVNPKRIESHEDEFTASKHRVFKLGAAVIDTNHFAVEHCVCASEVCGHFCRKVSKGCKGVPVAGQKATLAILQIRQCAESVQL